MDQVVAWVLRPALESEPAVPIAQLEQTVDEASLVENGDPLGDSGPLHNSPAVQTAQGSKRSPRNGSEDNKKKRAAKKSNSE